MQDLINKYRASLKMIRKSQQTANEEDKEHLEWMAGNLLFSIEWMRTGRQPGSHRGIERRAAYQRVIPTDPNTMQKYAAPVLKGECRSIKKADLDRIQHALSDLTEREREIYLKVKVDWYSYSQIADQLEISKATVQAIMTRAERKVTGATRQLDT